MSYDIKHTILLPLMIAMASVMVACYSEPDHTATQSQDEMTFEVAPCSRVVATTDTNIIERPFMLFGDVNLGGTNLKTIFDWHSVEYKNQIWDYGRATQYWYMGQEHSFVAVHPFIAKGDEQVTILTYKDNCLSFTYTLPDNMENAVDLLFATHRRKYNLDNKSPVKFQFTHLLARINVSMALVEKELMYDHVNEDSTYNRNEYIAVHSIEFNGIKTKASFGFYPKNLTSGNSTYDYEKTYIVRDDDRVEQKTVTLKEPNIVPNSYVKPESEEQEENYELEYVVALTEQEVIVMLPQEFGPDSDATMVINYSINGDNDLMRRIVVPLKNTVWKEGVSYTYKLLIDDPYYDHIIDDGKITVDIDDFRLHDDQEEGDDSWITDYDDPDHNVGYTFDDQGNCGPNDI